MTDPLLACNSGLNVISFGSSILVLTATLASTDSAADSRAVSNTTKTAGTSNFRFCKFILRRGAQSYPQRDMIVLCEDAVHCCTHELKSFPGRVLFPLNST